MIKKLLKDGEDLTRRASRVSMWGSWGVALVVTTLQVTGVVDRSYGIVAVLFIGIAIATGQARTRMKLQDSIVGAFEVGMKTAADNRTAEVEEVKEVVRGEGSREYTETGTRDYVERKTS